MQHSPRRAHKPTNAVLRASLVISFLALLAVTLLLIAALDSSWSETEADREQFSSLTSETRIEELLSLYISRLLGVVSSLRKMLH